MTVMPSSSVSGALLVLLRTLGSRQRHAQGVASERVTVTHGGLHVGLESVGQTHWRLSATRPMGSLAAGGLLALRFLALALDAGLLEMLATPRLGEDAALLDLLVEAPQGGFERLVLSDSDFSQCGVITSHRLA